MFESARMLTQPPLTPPLLRSSSNCPAGQDNNSKELSSGPIPSVACSRKSDTATVRVGRFPNGASFGEPVKEFDPRPVHNNIGDAQSVLCCDDPA